MRAMSSCCIAALVCSAMPLGAQPIAKLAAIGDSLSDEYAEEFYGSYSVSWTEILVQERGISMGPTAADAGVGNWNEPRRTGYQDNWARFGATTDTALSDGQHTGAADGINNRGVSHAVVWIGGNDLSQFHGPAYAAVYNGQWTQQQIDDYVQLELDNAEVILDALAATDAKVLVATLFDFGSMKRVEDDFPNNAGRVAAGQLYEDYSDGLTAMALQRGMPVLDLRRFSELVFGPHDNQNATLGIGGVDIDLNASGFGGDRTAAFVADRVHPRSTIQAVWCNAIIAGLNHAFDTGITPLTDTEILGLVSLAPTGPDELAATLGDLTRFVTLPEPPVDCLPDTNGDGNLTPADFNGWVLAFNTQAAKCDQNGDGQCLPSDFSAWIINFNAGCE